MCDGKTLTSVIPPFILGFKMIDDSQIVELLSRNAKNI
jgi:hypothetical protein